MISDFCVSVAARAMVKADLPVRCTVRVAKLFSNQNTGNINLLGRLAAKAQATLIY